MTHPLAALVRLNEAGRLDPGTALAVALKAYERLEKLEAVRDAASRLCKVHGSAPVLAQFSVYGNKQIAESYAALKTALARLKGPPV